MDELRPLTDTDSRDPLARLVRHARGLEVTYDVEAGFARHERAVAQGAVTASTGGLAKWGLAALATAIVAAGWLASRPDSSVTSSSGAHVSAPSSARASSPPVVSAVPRSPSSIAAPESAPAPASPSPSVASRGSAPAPTSAPVADKPGTPRRPIRREPVVNAQSASDPAKSDVAPEAPDDRIAREAAQIREIRGDLAAGRVAAALRGCDAGDLEFTDGVFAIERQALRVLTLFALGRRDEADRAAMRYLDAHPHGPLVAKIRAAQGA